MRTLALCLLLLVLANVSGNRTRYDDILDLEDGADCPKGTWSVDGTHFLGADECELCYEGEFNSEEAAIACELCPAGTYAPDMGYWECLKCPPGQITKETGNYECFPCGKGQHSPSEGGTDCLDCLPGYYQDEDGAGSCKICPVLTYGDVAGATACKDCPSNTNKEGLTECKVSCPAGQIEKDGKCESCPAGTYESEGECKPCGAGTFSDKPESVSCDLCGAGSYSAEGAVQCEDCSAGQYQDKTGQAFCEDCAAGYYGPDAAAASCIKCAAGYFNPQQGQSSCQECPAGTITTMEGQLACQECDAGWYSVSSSQCAECPAGHYSKERAAQCSPCATGSYSPQPGASGCMPSPAGTYVDKEGAIDTLVCPVGYFCPEGTVSPIECPAGAYCPEGSAEQVYCPVGTYNPNAKVNSVEGCIACPAGGYCAETGLVAPSGLCNAGYYCDAGSATPDQHISPAGHYCPAGAADPTPCPRSTYNELTGMSSVADCKSCPEGQETLVEGATSLDQCQNINCSPGQYRDPVKWCISCPRGTFSNIENAVACRPCPRHQYSSVEGAVQCMQCPVTAFTWTEGTDSLDGCIGPVIEVCTGEDMTGNCYRYYDDNLNLNTTIRSVKVISGEFELFDKNDQAGYFKKISENDGPVNVNELGNLSGLRSVKALLNDVFCSLDKGENFHGSIRSTSKSGKACINWKRTPLAHKAVPNHYCQNPDGNRLRAKPFCYISETETEECDIPSCIWDMDCYTGNGVQYRGKVGLTSSDYDCQNWNRDYPVIHGYHSPEYNWAGVGEHTFCRNPSPESEDRPWCFKDTFWTWIDIWDFCDISKCSRNKFDYYRF